MQTRASVMNYGKGWSEHVCDCERGHATSPSSLWLNLIFRGSCDCWQWNADSFVVLGLWIMGGRSRHVYDWWLAQSPPWTHYQIHIATHPLICKQYAKINMQSHNFNIHQLKCLRCSIGLADVCMCGVVHVYAWVQSHTCALCLKLTSVNMNLPGSSYLRSSWWYFF